jgi:hypothetical protein
MSLKIKNKMKTHLLKSKVLEIDLQDSKNNAYYDEDEKKEEINANQKIKNIEYQIN